LGEGIAEWSETLGGWRFLYLTADTTIQPYRWTYAYLNGIMFFCHPVTGIIAYDVANDLAFKLEGEGVPANAIAIVENNGRLGVMDDLYLYWSEQSDGSAFAPSLGGAGFQLISDRVPGFPIMVTSYTQGILVWTTGGVMRSEFTGDAAVYRHRALNSEYRPVNSFCTVKMNQDSVIILDERGLFQSNGEAPTPMTPLFNEFLIDYLQRLNLKIGQNVRLEWDDLQRRLYVSVSLSYANPIYERAFVLYPPLDKWGEFNESHYGVFPVTIKDSSRADDYYAFSDSEGVVRTWQERGDRESDAVDTSLDLVYPVIQKPFNRPGDEDGLVLGSSMGFQTVPGTAGRRAAFYPRDGAVPATVTVQPLNAKIQFGLIRAGGDDSAGRMSDIIGLMIGNIVSGDEVQAGEDYATVPDGVDDEDYLTETGGEDFGIETANYINHGLRVIGTIDGKSIFDEAYPELERFDKASRHYSCIVGGVWHIVEMTAEVVGQAFHLQALELTATDGGLLL
jgi:hypothetical protein